MQVCSSTAVQQQSRKQAHLDGHVLAAGLLEVARRLLRRQQLGVRGLRH